MIEDFRAFGRELAQLNADICIVGCGPVGIALAEELEKASLQIVIVESGGLSIDAALQVLNEGTVLGLPHTGHREGRGRAIGGTSHLWAGQCLRLDPIDFERREWVPYSGWPLSADTLSRHYARAEDFFKIGEHSYDERNYTLSGLRPPLWNANTLVNHFTIYTPEVATASYHLAHLRKSSRIRVLSHAHAVQIETNEAVNQVTGVAVRAIGGKAARIRARMVVLCAGGIENARILLSSRERQPEGLGNSAGLVGRFFQEHPNGITATLDEGETAMLQESFRLLYRGAFRFFPKLALSPVLQRQYQVLNCNAHLIFEFPENSGVAALQEIVRAFRQRRLPKPRLRQLGNALLDFDAVRSAAVRRFIKGKSPVGKPSAVRLQCYVEQAPNPDSRIHLDCVSDALGLPRLCVDWQMTALERHTLITMTRVVSQEFERLGLGRFQLETWMDYAGDGWMSGLSESSHHIGTTRMASSPKNGVVDPECEIFGVDGLYIAGSSVFPTSGYANPTLTAVALGMRVADTLKRRFGFM